jgi:hypothetical protein
VAVLEVIMVAGAVVGQKLEHLQPLVVGLERRVLLLLRSSINESTYFS